MKHRPITFRSARAFITGLHRHHKPPQGHKFSLGAFVGDNMVAVVVVGRPVARMSDNGLNAEITRLCSDGTPNACSFLYSKAFRVCQAMGYEKVTTALLWNELGTSAIAAGFEKSHDTDGGSWSRPSRGRTDKHPTCPKQIFVKRCKQPADRVMVAAPSRNSIAIAAASTGVVGHWNEFGPEHGFEEAVSRLERAIMAAEGRSL